MGLNYYFTFCTTLPQGRKKKQNTSPPPPQSTLNSLGWVTLGCVGRVDRARGHHPQHQVGYVKEMQIIASRYNWLLLGKKVKRVEAGTRGKISLGMHGLEYQVGLEKSSETVSELSFGHLRGWRDVIGGAITCQQLRNSARAMILQLLPWGVQFCRQRSRYKNQKYFNVIFLLI